MRPGIRRAPIEAKSYRVRTRHPPTKWLFALDPLTTGQAQQVRSEWRAKEDEATTFSSRGYADQVAARNPGLLHYVVERTAPR